MGQLLNIVQEVWIKGRIAHEVHLFCPVLLKLGTPQGQTNGRCVMAIAAIRMPDCIEHISHPPYSHKVFTGLPFLVVGPSGYFQVL